MAKINGARLALGALAAGVVLNAFDFVVNNFVMASAWQSLTQVHNIDQAAMGSTQSMINFIVLDMGLGFLIMWTYAAIRPRYGPGASTAFRAGLSVWGAVALTTATFGGWFLPLDLVLKTAGLALITYVAAGLAAGYVYQEAVQAPASDEWYQK